MPGPPENRTLWHGTTRRRAESIVANGPDASFLEPGEKRRGDVKDFWAVDAASTPSTWSMGSPFDQARDKHELFDNEGGPAIVEFEVPIIVMRELEADAEFAAVLSSGAVQFREYWGVPQLRRIWQTLPRRILMVS
jgi:hypothetical protein